MPVEAECSNPQCGIMLTLQDQLAGKKVRCPQCGTTIQVPEAGGAVGEALESQPAPPPQASVPPSEAPVPPQEAAPAKPPGFHPARQVCTLCGAVLGVRVKFCPKCGADVRTGVAAEVQTKVEQKGKGPLVLVLVGAVVLAVLGVGSYLAYSHWDSIFGGSGEGDGGQAVLAPQKPKDGVKPAAPKARQKPESPREQPQAPAPKPAPRQQKPAPAYKYVPSEEEERLELAANTYLLRLAEAAGARDFASTEDVAERWTDLWEYCREQGLVEEAEQCWYRAVFSQPRASATNRRLGRTESWRGFAVTAEQKDFLDSLRTRVRIVHNDPTFDALTLHLPGGKTSVLPPGGEVDFEVEPGHITVSFDVGGAGSSRFGSAGVEVSRGEVATITFPATSLSMLVPAAQLGDIYQGQEQWRRYAPARSRWSAAQLKQAGWTQSGSTWTLSGSVKASYQTDSQGILTGISASGATLDRGGGKVFGVRRSSDGIFVVGDFRVNAAGVSWEMTGTEELPLRLVLADPAWAWVRSGTVLRNNEANTYHDVEGVPGLAHVTQTSPGPELDMLWRAVSSSRSAQGAVASVRARRSELDEEAKHLEARGELLGGWHTELRTRRAMADLEEQQWRLWQMEGQARALSAGADRLAALGVRDRLAYQELDWPRFREPLAAAVGQSLAAQNGSEVDVDLLPLLPQAQVRARLSSLARGVTSAHGAAGSAADLKRAIRTQRFVNDRYAVAFLSGLVRDAPPEFQTEALLALSEIGTRDAVAACRARLLEPEAWAAKLAALAGAGDPQTLETLTETLTDKHVRAEDRRLFLKDLLSLDSPTALLAISRVQGVYVDEQDRAAIAQRLGEIGGHVAMLQLARLMEASGKPYAEVVETVPVGRRLLLVKALGGMLQRYGPDSDTAALLLGKTRVAVALPLLKDAVQTKGYAPALAGLAALGSAQAFDVAAAATDVVGAKDLQSMVQYWGKPSGRGGGWTWDPAVDRRSAIGFLETVLTDWQNLETRLAAAELIMQVGGKPGPTALLEIASIPTAAPVPGKQQYQKPTAPATLQVQKPPARAGKPEPAQPAPGKKLFQLPEMRVPQGGGTAPGARGTPAGQVSKASDAWDKLSKARDAANATAQMEALVLLGKNMEPNVAPTLRQLAEQAGDAEIRARALTLLGQVADEAAMDYLRELAQGRQDEKFRDPAEMLSRMRVRTAAAAGLCAAGDRSAVSLLLVMLMEDAPSAGDFQQPPPAPELKTALEMRELVLNLGVAEAVQAIPAGQSLADLAGGPRGAQGLVRAIADMAERNGRAIGETPGRPGAEAVAASALRALGRAGTIPEGVRQLIAEFIMGSPQKCTAPVRHGILEAVVNSRDRYLHQALAGLLPGWLKDEGLSSHWQELSLVMASRGQATDWEMLRTSLGGLDAPTLRDMLQVVKASPGDRSEVYYRLLCGLATTSLREPTPPEEKKPAAKEPKKKEPARPQPPARPGGDIMRGFHMHGEVEPMQPDEEEPPRQQDSPSVQAQPKPADDATVPARPDPKVLADMEFRQTCLDELGKGAKRTVVRVLADDSAGMLRDQSFGPWTVWMLWQGAPELRAVAGPGEVSPLAQLLKEQYGSLDDVGGQRAVVAVARKIGSDEMTTMLGDLLVGGDGPITGVARALGQMNQPRALYRALDYRRKGNSVEFAYPAHVRAAALVGVANLPDSEDPIRYLRSYLVQATEPELRKATEGAMLTAYGLRARRGD